ncbi:M28 family peptidase [Nitrosococcus wardiae]|uniref:M28 family peptidase n=1 Tax=Nitrosococcus wardiae TaxID=1814290 RepID=A0A4P7C1C3_9GAMM|nr:M28 family peptidase [Nitrosococcus wardiae]QBQ56171.1 M28 family peptidase [Nitrosococcus wardiae]
MKATKERLRSHVQTLASEIGERHLFRPQALHAAADYITQEWQNQGYQVAAQNYEVNGISCANLEISQRGLIFPEDIILIGAHYDSVVGSPGANDNGSGIAALLEISRLFTTLTPRNTVRFVAFSNEEPPFFTSKHMGSLVYAQTAHRRQDKIRLMVSLETIGYFNSAPGSQHYPPLFNFFYPNRGDFIAFISNFRSRKVMRQAAQAFRRHSQFPLEYTATFANIPGVSWSDHWSFWHLGYRAFMITDTAPYRYAYYHSAQDTPEKVCFEALTHLTDGLFMAFADLAN